MAKVINEDIQSNVKALITQITTFQPPDENFTRLEKTVLSTLRKSDTMYFLNTKDIKKAVWSMADKFMFHGFFKHAEYLKQTHDKYIDENLSESDLTPRLNVVKFLLCMSENPTIHFWQSPHNFTFIEKDNLEDSISDWGAYLNEGISRWSPIREDSFQENFSDDEKISSPPDWGFTPRAVITETREIEEFDFRQSRSKLVQSVQNGWFSGESVCMKPQSDWFDASVGILWEQHLQEQVKDLIQVEPVTVISEYKVMREILWQMFGPHNSTVFQLKVDKLLPRTNVTISSVCAMTFERFIACFIPYIEILDEFRQFLHLLEEKNSCETYKSYANSVEKITKSAFQRLVDLEREIREQENTMTLLKLAQNFEEIFKPIYTLKQIHDEVILENFHDFSPLICALTLLSRLRKGLDFSLNKMEQDIRLTLYLESLFYYLTMTDAWLVKNDLFDHTEEFVIANKNVKSFNKSENFEMNFVLQENLGNFKENGIIKIICEEVLQVGRNIHLLCLLEKYDVFVKGQETIYEEFVRRIIEELSAYYGYEIKSEVMVEKKVSFFDLKQMGDWDDFVDLSDGFLTKAFENLKLPTEKIEKKCLYEKVSEITTNLFPFQNLPEKVFSQILKDRFTISGLMVKNILIENYKLDKQFEFLNHMYLFWDDLIFPFYRNLFERMNTANANWGNGLWLMSLLHDVLMDPYPNFYENCTIQIQDSWKSCRNSLEACNLVNVIYEIKWPLSIVITDEHLVLYREIFQFLLRIKWALYTANHLSFTDVEPKGKAKKPTTAIKRLKYLRFNLINILNTVQHYVFGLILAKNRIQFELDFEKATDLKSLIAAHEDFVRTVHRAVAEIRDKRLDEQGFNTLLKCVKMLKVMWNTPAYATAPNLESCRRIYVASFEVVNSVVNPVFCF